MFHNPLHFLRRWYLLSPLSRWNRHQSNRAAFEQSNADSPIEAAFDNDYVDAPGFTVPLRGDESQHLEWHEFASQFSLTDSADDSKEMPPIYVASAGSDCIAAKDKKLIDDFCEWHFRFNMFMALDEQLTESPDSLAPVRFPAR
jgi:hypothetical protein